MKKKYDSHSKKLAHFQSKKTQEVHQREKFTKPHNAKGPKTDTPKRMKVSRARNVRARNPFKARSAPKNITEALSR